LHCDELGAHTLAAMRNGQGGVSFGACYLLSRKHLAGVSYWAGKTATPQPVPVQLAGFVEL